MKVWVIRAGKNGEQEQFALANGYAVISWRKLRQPIPPDEESLRAAIRKAYPDESGGWPSDFSQTWKFANEVRKGDLVILPLKKRPDGKLVRRPKEDGVVAVGEVVDHYEYAPDGEQGTKHRRKVKWINRDVSRARLPDDIAARVCFQWTVFRVDCDGAERRIREIAGSA